VNYGANPHTGGLTSLRGRDVADAVAEWKRTADPADVERLARSLADEAGADDELAVYLAEQAAKRAATRRV
jgi:hypothetical protein